MSETPSSNQLATQPKPKRKPKKPALPSAEDLARQLLALNGGLMMGQISASDGNLLHKNIKAVMDLQARRENGPDKPQTPEGLLDRVRKDPSLLNTLESFIPDDQLDALMKQLGEDE